MKYQQLNLFDVNVCCIRIVLTSVGEFYVIIFCLCVYIYIYIYIWDKKRLKWVCRIKLCCNFLPTNNNCALVKNLWQRSLLYLFSMKLLSIIYDLNYHVIPLFWHRKDSEYDFPSACVVVGIYLIPRHFKGLRE